MPSLAPTPQQLANRQLATGVPGAAPAPTNAASSVASPAVTPTAGYNDNAARQLSDYLGTGTLSPQEQGYESTIMDRFGQAQKNTQSQYQNEYGAISADYANQLDQLNRDVQNQQTGTLESRSGFATNTAILRNLQETGTNRIATLENAREEALLHNNANMADSLNQLIMNEQQLITSARQNYVGNLTSAATLETPQEKNQLAFQQQQQQSMLQLQQLAPDAGISTNDSYDQAIAKFRNSNYYKNNIGQAQSTIAQLQAEATAANASAVASRAQAGASSAQAGLTGAQANLTNRQLSYLSPGSSSNYVAQLQSGQITPDELQKNLQAEGDIGGYQFNQIMQDAAGQGYNQHSADLKALGQQTSTQAANSGSLYNMVGTAIGNVVNPFISAKLGGNSGRSLAPSFSTPAFAKGQVQVVNGVKYVFDGTNFVKQK